MRILITGGFGYIGGRLSCYFKKLFPEYELYLTTTRSQYPQWAQDLNVKQINIVDKKQVAEYVKATQPDAIIHLAGLSQRQCDTDPHLASQVNVEGTRNLISSAVEVGANRFVYLSTFQVYGSGDSLTGDITESTELQPINEYGCSKLNAERVVLSSDYDKIDRIVLRLSNAFGAPADMNVSADIWRLVFNAFCLGALKDGVIAPRSNSARDFIAMMDVLRAVHHCLQLPANDCGVYNLGGENVMTVNAVADLVAHSVKGMYGRDVSVYHADAYRSKEFHYAIEKIRATGFFLDKDVENEVNMLLNFIHENVV